MGRALVKKFSPSRTENQAEKTIQHHLRMPASEPDVLPAYNPDEVQHGPVRRGLEPEAHSGGNSDPEDDNESCCGKKACFRCWCDNIWQEDHNPMANGNG